MKRFVLSFTFVYFTLVAFSAPATAHHAFWHVAPHDVFKYGYGRHHNPYGRGGYAGNYGYRGYPGYYPYAYPQPLPAYPQRHHYEEHHDDHH